MNARKQTIRFGLASATVFAAFTFAAGFAAPTNAEAGGVSVTIGRTYSHYGYPHVVRSRVVVVRGGGVTYPYYHGPYLGTPYPHGPALHHHHVVPVRRGVHLHVTPSVHPHMHLHRWHH